MPQGAAWGAVWGAVWGCCVGHLNLVFVGLFVGLFVGQRLGYPNLRRRRDRRLTIAESQSFAMRSLPVLSPHLGGCRENAVTVVYALGGSTNAVLHLLAIA